MAKSRCFILFRRHTHTHTSELVVPPTKMLWDAGLVSSGFSGATEATRRVRERSRH